MSRYVMYVMCLLFSCDRRARDKVIYIRVDEALKKRFDRIKEASGYKGNADFLNYLLDVYDGKRVDGVTLKDIRELLAQAVHEMKKQGVNINQIAYTINIYPGVFSFRQPMYF